MPFWCRFGGKLLNPLLQSRDRRETRPGSSLAALQRPLLARLRKVGASTSGAGGRCPLGPPLALPPLPLTIIRHGNRGTAT